MNAVDISDSLACAIQWKRDELGISKIHKLEQDTINELEKELNCEIPQAILAYYAAGLAGMNDMPRKSIRALIGLTHQLVETLDDYEYDSEWDYSSVVVFDHDNGNYLAVNKKGGGGEDILFVDHEGYYTDIPTSMSLAEYIAGGDAVPMGDKAKRFTCKIVPPSVEDFRDAVGTKVNYLSYGIGEVIAVDSLGPKVKWTVEFEDGVTKNLIAEWLEVVE